MTGMFKVNHLYGGDSHGSGSKPYCIKLISSLLKVKLAHQKILTALKWTPSQGQKRTNYQWAHGFTQAFGCEAAGHISAGERLSSPKLKSAPQGAEVCHSSGVW